jgi:carboxylesterase type B
VLGKVVHYNGKPFSAFSGLRYAKAPVGKLRFMPPEAYDEAWNGDLVKTYILITFFDVYDLK